MSSIGDDVRELQYSPIWMATTPSPSRLSKYLLKLKRDHAQNRPERHFKVATATAILDMLPVAFTQRRNSP